MNAPRLTDTVFPLTVMPPAPGTPCAPQACNLSPVTLMSIATATPHGAWVLDALTVQVSDMFRDPRVNSAFGREVDSCQTDLDVPVAPLNPAAVGQRIAALVAKNGAKTPIGASHRTQLMITSMASPTARKRCGVSDPNTTESPGPAIVSTPSTV